MNRIFNIFIFIGIVFTLTFLNGCTSHYIYPEAEISVENLKQTVHFLSTLNPPRNCYYTNSLNKSANYISQKFIEFGLSPWMQKFDVSGKIYKNVVASVGPTNGPRIIVGAHYDVCGNQPGADDNASGISGLLEIARFAKKHETNLPYRVDFVAYTLEEPPFFRTTNMGSYVHATYLHKNKIKLKGMICLEMIGFFSDEENSQTYPLSIMHLFCPSKGNFISLISNFGSSSLTKQLSQNIEKTSVDLETIKAPSFIKGVDFSDHRNYWKFGYDAVMVTDTAFYRNPNYHERSDTIDSLNFCRMKEVVKGVCWTLLNMK